MRWIFFESAGSDPAEFRDLMQAEGDEFRRLLATRQVDYAELKNALIPTSDGRQVVFLYDWLNDDSWNYAVAMAERYLPHLRVDIKTSVFQGDLLGGHMPVSAFDAALVRAHGNSVNWQTQFAVYFSNLRDGDVAAIHVALLAEPRYSGYIDVSIASAIRDYLACTIPALWVLAGRTVLLNHGGDDPFVSDEDPIGFDLPSYGYTVVSLVDSYFVAFLDYKIEARDAQGSAEDRILCLAATSGELVNVETATIVVPSAKLDQYLLREPNKLSLMTSIGLQDVTPDELARVIRDKLAQSYIYDFRFAPDGTPLFAIAAEFEKPDGTMTRRLIALKYDAISSAISLVSMY